MAERKDLHNILYLVLLRAGWKHSEGRLNETRKLQVTVILCAESYVSDFLSELLVKL